MVINETKNELNNDLSFLTTTGAEEPNSQTHF